MDPSLITSSRPHPTSHHKAQTGLRTPFVSTSLSRAPSRTPPHPRIRDALRAAPLRVPVPRRQPFASPQVRFLRRSARSSFLSHVPRSPRHRHHSHCNAFLRYPEAARQGAGDRSQEEGEQTRGRRNQRTRSAGELGKARPRQVQGRRNQEQRGHSRRGGRREYAAPAAISGGTQGRLVGMFSFIVHVCLWWLMITVV